MPNIYVYYDAIFFREQPRKVLLEYHSSGFGPYLRGWAWGADGNSSWIGLADGDLTLLRLRTEKKNFNIIWEKQCEFVDVIGELFPELL